MSRRRSGYFRAFFLGMLGIFISLSGVAEGIAATETPSTPENGEPLQIVGIYPTNKVLPANEIVIYFNEPLAMYKPVNGYPEPCQVFSLLSPPHVYIEENYLRIQSDDKMQSHKSIIAIAIEISPALTSIKGKVLPEEARRLYFSYSSKPSFNGRIEKKGDHLLATVSVPLVNGLWESFYTLSIQNDDSNPLDNVVPTVSNGENEYCCLFALNSPFPKRAAFIRKANTPLSDKLPWTIAISLASSKALSLVTASWQKEENLSDRLDLCFTEPVDANTALANLSLVADGVTLKLTPVETEVPEDHIILQVDPALELNTEALLTLKAPLVGKNNGIMVADGSMAVTLKNKQDVSVATDNNETGHEATEKMEIHGGEYWSEEGVDGAQLSFWMNCTIDDEALKKNLTITPAVENLTVKSRDRGFSLSADWHAGQAYRITLAKGLTNVSGTTELKSDFVINTDTAPKVSGASFSLGERYYIPGKQFGPVTIKARNLTEAKVTVSRLFASNFTNAIEQMQGGRVYSDFDERYTEPILTQAVSFPDVPDKIVTAKVDLNAMMPVDKRGVFTVQVNPGQWDNTQIVLWTNIGAIAHWVSNSCRIFAHDLHTLAPVAAAKVTLYSNKSQILATTLTDAAGVAAFDNLDNRLGRPRVALLETADDATFLELSPREEDKLPFDNNMAPYDAQGYDAYIYLDRNLYRPGEPIHARGIVRTHYVDAACHVPLLMRVQNPKNRLLQSTPVTTSEVGTVSLDIASEKSWPTGKYTVELCVPGKEENPIGTVFFNVEEFVPNRMKAEVSVDKPIWKLEDPVAIHLKAENLYGGPAAARKTDAVIIFRPGEFRSEKFPGYVFRNDSKIETFAEQLGEQQTDEQGATEYSFTYTGRENITMPLAASVRGMVYELGGRDVRARAEATVFPAPIALGLGLAPAPDTKGVDVSVAAITPEETAANLSSVKVTLEKEDWIYHMRTFDGRYEPGWTREYQAIETRDVSLQNGVGNIRFDMTDRWGKYRVRVYAEATPLYSSGTFYCGWNRIELTSASSPTLIELALNQQKYTLGDTCELRIKSPFDGMAFVVLQGDSFKKTFQTPITNNEGMLSFPIEEGHFPNVWAEVTVVRKINQENTQVYPFSSFAMIDIPVTDGHRGIQVSYPGLPEEVRPAQKIDFVVETHNNTGEPIAAEVTLAAVDEGIHGILDYANPDPFTHFQRARQPWFLRAHYYDKIAYDFEETQIGGDALEKRLGKSPQIGDNWIKPVALWSGAVHTDESGKATVSLEVPEFNGQLRLVAVAVDTTSTGMGAADIYVRRPHILQTSMPRFVLAGDTFASLATVINTTKDPCQALVQWRSEGTLTGQGEQILELPASGEGTAKADFASGMIGQGKICWTVAVKNPADGSVIETLTQEAPLPVRPPAAWQSTMDSLVILPGETKYIQNTQFQETDEVELSLTASANPLLRMAKGLRYLLRYPYGCVEQTTSSLMPLYLLKEQAALFKDSLPKEMPADEATIKSYIQAGINRLFSMQTVSGGLAYWPGDVTPYPYGSVYAAQFLTMAFKDNSAVISEKSFRSLQNYLRQIMNGHIGAIGYSEKDLYLRAYAIYVLALDGQLDAIDAISRLDNYTLPDPARFMLAAALAVNTGDMERVKKYLNEHPKAPYDEVGYSGILNSAIRNKAVELMAGLQMKSPVKTLQPLADELVNWLQNAPHYTTHQTGFIIMALTQYLAMLNTDMSKAKAHIVAPEGAKDLAGTDVYRASVKGPGKVFTVINQGEAPLYVYGATAGIPLQPRTEEVSENDLRIHRDFNDDRGNPLEAEATFAHGGTYLVDLTIASGQPLENVAVSDLVPAGFEIANRRLDTDALAAMGKGGTTAAEGEASGDDSNAEESAAGEAGESAGITPSFLEVRDDRLVLAFDTLPAGTHHFYYVVRAISTGTFRYPAAIAEAMYNPAVRAATVDTTITVE